MEHILLKAFLFFPVSPNIEVPNQLVGVQEGQQMTLECFSEAFPKSINYWTRDDNNNLIANGGSQLVILILLIQYLITNKINMKHLFIRH